MSRALPEDATRPLVVEGDALEVLRQLPSSSVHLIVTDPPYFRVKELAWDRQWASPEAFLAWMSELAEEWQRVLVPHGSIYVFASPQMAARVELVIRERFEVLNSIVWLKPEDTGPHRRTRKKDLRHFFANTERVIFAEQLEPGYKLAADRLRGEVFEPLRAYLAEAWARAGLTHGDLNRATGSQMATHWLSPVQWALPTSVQYAKMQARAGTLDRTHDELQREYLELRRAFEARRAELDRRPFTVTREVPYTDVWRFPTVERYPGKHPCEKPRELMAHMIAASSRPGDLVLDCFLGSGVTGEQALALGRRFIGVERDAGYAHAARQRIAAAVATPEASAHANEQAPAGSQLSLLLPRSTP